uniref:Cannabinoid receptor interacting protein 1a n=1 Tax=Neogobius melanostomus TaxID=47308 RepID=A0A8C6TAC3_9GOBI
MEGDGVPPLLDISIALRLQPNDGPVFFKVDGTRFGQGRTIKLLTGSKYRVEVVMNKRCFSDCADYETSGVRCCPLEEQSRDRASFQKAGTFETVWQAKFYNYYKRDIDYECKPNETRTLMWVNKEAFN